MSLPARLTCPQDIEDVYAHFQNEANDYVARRLPFAMEQSYPQHDNTRFFISAYDIRYVSDYQIQGLRKVDADHSECIYMQRAVNLLDSVRDVLARKLDDGVLHYLRFNNEFQEALKVALAKYDALRAPQPKDDQ